MGVDVMGPGSIELHGSPDDIIGTPESRGGAAQVMHIELTQEILDELLACTRSGRPPQILFGRNPRLEVGDKAHRLDSIAEQHRHELYRYDTDVEEGEEQPWSFAGLVNHSLELRRVEEKTAELDEAVEDLKQRMATINERKEASKTIIATELAPSGRPQKKSAHLRTPSLLNNLKPSSRPASPSLSAVGSPALAPTSAPTSDDHKVQMAMRKAITHFLAVKPRTTDEVVARTRVRRSTVDSVLQKIAKRKTATDNGEDVWQLTDNAYKSLDLYGVGYGETARKAAQENAIRAFDRQRIPRTDKLWQLLLPEEDRGKGIVLSRLGDLSQGPRGGTPMVNAQKVDRKTGLPKKDLAKKERKEKKSDEGEDRVVHTAEEGKKAPARDKAGKETGKRLQAKGTVTPSGSTPLASPSRKPDNMSNGPARSHGAPKTSSQPASKPKNPSPLGSSPPTNASDFGDDHPAATKPSMKKRKANDVGPGASPTTKVRKIRPSTQAPNGNTPTRSRTPAQRPNGGTQMAPHPVNGVNGATHSSSSGSPSPELQLSWRQTMDMAAKFKRYYERYEKLYHQLADNPKPPTEESRQELMKMHERLSEMKREISVGSLRN